MTLDETIRKGIADLPESEAPQTFSLAHNGCSVDIGVIRHDEYSGLLSDVKVRRDQPAAGTQKEWAERLAENVTSLAEPLKVHEIHDSEDRAWLRSATPAPKGDGGVQYYEAELHGTSEVHLRRHKGYVDPGKRREQVPFPATYETLGRLVDELSA